MQSNTKSRAEEEYIITRFAHAPSLAILPAPLLPTCCTEYVAEGIVPFVAILVPFPAAVAVAAPADGDA